MDMRCNISFQSGNYQYKLAGYRSKEEALSSKSIKYIYENTSLNLWFNDDNNGRLYAPMLRGYDIDNIMTDDKGVYFKPSHKAYSIIDYGNGKNMPLIPGKYCFEYCNEDEIIYYPFIVENNNSTMKIPIWEQMRKDIEEFSKELTIQYVEGNASIELDKSSENMTTNIMYKIHYVVEHKKYILQQLHTIENLNVSEIRKEYQWQDDNKGGRSDFRTLKMRQKNPNRSKSYIRKSNLTFDTFYNRGLKYCLNYIARFCHEANKIINSHLLKLQKEYNEEAKYFNSNHAQKIYKTSTFNEQINEFIYYKEVLKKIRNKILYITNESWLKNVSSNNYLQLTKKMIMNPQYNYFYKLYKVLSDFKGNLKIAKEYTMQLKPSNELYEIWCFIYLIKLLKEISFIPYEGWIFSKNNEIPYLFEGDYVCFRKDNIYLKLVFNETIYATKLSETSDSHPFYTRKRKNHPDIRLDIYEDELSYGNYKKSIIFDSKYKNSKNIFEVNRSGGNFDYANTYKQLSEYQDGIRHRFTKEQCIFAAIAMYPTDGLHSREDEQIIEEYRSEWRGFKIDALRVSPVLKSSNEAVNKEFISWIVENINSIISDKNHLDYNNNSL